MLGKEEDCDTKRDFAFRVYAACWGIGNGGLEGRPRSKADYIGGAINPDISHFFVLP